jgi:hypothetical protein
MENSYCKLAIILIMVLLFSCEKQSPPMCKTCITITTVFNADDTTTVMSEPFEACDESLRVYDNLVTRIVKADSAENTLVSITICDY